MRIKRPVPFALASVCPLEAVWNVLAINFSDILLGHEKHVFLSRFLKAKMFESAFWET